MSRSMPALAMRQIETLSDFQRYQTGIAHLLDLHRSVLLDDFSGDDPAVLVANTATYIPWLWLLVDGQDQVYGLACLSDVIPGRHAYVHGVSHPAIRKHPAIDMLGRLVLAVAFERLQVVKVKAEIEAANRGARGYCLRMGFRREACFKQDNRIGGQWQDVYVYSRFAPSHPCRADMDRRRSV